MTVPSLEELKAYFREAVAQLLGADPGDFPFEYPPRVELGDLAMSFPFALAKELRRAPKQIAEQIVEGIKPPESVSRLEAAGAGYINLFFDRRAVALALYESRHAEPVVDPAQPHITVEHTSVNPNKAMHIGHIRNSCLGDTLVRLVRYLGRPVRVQNYIDDTGVQVADVVVGFMHLLNMGLADVQQVAEPFDHFCWDLYARVGEFYAEEKGRLELRRRTLHAMETGLGTEAEIGAAVADRVVHCHLRTLQRLGIRYDLLVWESDILRSRFWERAFKLLRRQGVIYKAEEGKNAGCWVMELGASELLAQMDDPDKIIVRSDGTVTYVGKDIAYHLWKFGRLGTDFRYRPYFTYADGSQVWTTTSSEEETEAMESPPADVIFNVIDVGQDYTQKVVAESIRSIAGQEAAEGYHHFSYEKVALTPASCRELGVQLEPGEEDKPFIAMSGRRGLGVKADDLIDALLIKAREEVRRRNPDFSEPETEDAADAIAVNALRYFMIHFARSRVLAFDFDAALAFEGESGPYITYALVRANNIFNKLAEEDGLTEEGAGELLGSVDWNLLQSGEGGDETWELLSLIARMPSVASEAVRAMELSVFAKFVYALAQRFNAWYHKYPILREGDAELKRLRTVVLQIVRGHLARALDLLAMRVPRRM